MCTPPDLHDHSAQYLMRVIEDMSVNPDLKWAAHLLTAELWRKKLCTQESVGLESGNSIFEFKDHIIAEAFRLTAKRKQKK